MTEKIEYRCRSCGMVFGSLGDMQRHIVTEHLQSRVFAKEISEAA
ncbi:hypothetical protein [Candidatus Nitrososphaera sp. FF02]